MTRLAGILAVPVLLFVSLSARATALDSGCEMLPATPLVSVSTLPVTVVAGIRPDDVRSMTLRTTGAESLRTSATVGTTHADARWNVSYGLDAQPDNATGGVCYRPSINVVIGYEPMHISVANLYPDGTCAFEAIAAHEHGHVAIYERFLPSAARAIEQSVQERISDRIRHAISAAAMSSELSQISQQVSTIVTQEMAKSEDLQRRFDSAEESQRLLNACGGEVRQGLTREVLSWKSATTSRKSG